MLRLKVVGITDLIATIVVLPDCIDRRNLVIASEAKQSRAAGQRGRRTRDCFVAPPLAMTAQPEGRRVGLRPPSVSSATQCVENFAGTSGIRRCSIHLARSRATPHNSHARESKGRFLGASY